MALFLVQHGLSLPKETDPERGLSDEGRTATLRIAEVASHYSIPVKQIVHSGKKRASMTAELFQAALLPGHASTAVAGIKPNDDVMAFAESADLDSGMMVVGHLPFMERLVSFLTTGSADNCVYRFQNSGIVCLDKDDTGWFIKWTLNPDIS